MTFFRKQKSESFDESLNKILNFQQLLKENKDFVLEILWGDWLWRYLKDHTKEHLKDSFLTIGGDKFRKYFK